MEWYFGGKNPYFAQSKTSTVYRMNGRIITWRICTFESCNMSCLMAIFSCGLTLSEAGHTDATNLSETTHPRNLDASDFLTQNALKLSRYAFFSKQLTLGCSGISITFSVNCQLYTSIFFSKR